MWSLTNDYGLTNIGGDRPLGEYTEVQRQIKLAYDLATKLASSGDIPEVYADINVGNHTYEVAQGNSAAALAYGLKPYIVAPQYIAQALTPLPKNDDVPTLNNNMKRSFLRTILRKIVEEA